MTAERRELPLFPLKTVLFPGGTLPLHVFEPRYRALTRACLADDRRFGVVLIAEGQEVGSPAVPHPVGTVAVIRQAEPQSDGRYYLMTSGERRFAIEHHWLDPSGYLVGSVRLLLDQEDQPTAALSELVGQLRDVLSAYITRLTPEAASLQTELERQRDPVLLAGLAATLLRAEPPFKQQLLEINSVPLLLQRLLQQFRRELAVLEVLARPAVAPLRNDVISPN